MHRLRKIEAPQNRVGVCQDRKVELVYAFEHDEALTQIRFVRKQVKDLRATLLQLVCTTPREGEWERSYRAMQSDARRALAKIGGDAPDLDIATISSRSIL